MKKAGIGSHTRPNRGEHVIYLTPPEVLYSLGKFDLDPCAAPSPRPWPTASTHIELPDDGLLLPWHGRVWLNPPYDESLGRWLERMAEHGCGIALIFARTETTEWQRLVWPAAKGVLFPSGRFYFRLPDGSQMPGNAGGPSALVAYSADDAHVLKHSSIAGAFVKVERCRVPKTVLNNAGVSVENKGLDFGV